MVGLFVIEKFIKYETNFSILEEISEDDLQDIINIRTNKNNSVLHPISNKLTEQLAYFENYQKTKKINGEIYYKIYEKKFPKIKCGFVRITQLNNNHSFSWESFILNDDVSPHISYDVMISIYSIGFDFFKKKLCGPWNVPNRAMNIMKFHEFTGMAEIVSKNEQFTCYEVTSSSYEARIDFFKKRKLGIINT
jgi:hypothetical protein